MLHEKGSRASDAQDLLFAGEMAEAARSILEHPALTERQRAIWALHIEEGTYSQIARSVRCSYRDISRAIDDVTALMLHPRWEEYPMRPPPKRRRRETEDEPAPLVGLCPVPFQDLETSITFGVETAHRKIVELHSKDFLSSDDVADNERAVHTLLAVRKSELEYLKGKVPPKPVKPDEEVRAMAGRVSP